MRVLTHRLRYLYALSILIGTIVGVGFFGLPYAALQAGYGTLLLYFVLLGAVVLLTHLFYAEFSLHTKGHHRLVGYASLYLGRFGKWLTFHVKMFGIFGALLAYLLIGGRFLASLFGGSVILYTFLFFLAGAWLVWRGSRSIGPVELVLLGIFVLLVVIVFIAGIPSLRLENITGFSSAAFFLPYGIVLFSLWGIDAIPELRDLLWHDAKHMRRAITYGVLISICIYIVFTFFVLGISGTTTTKDALSGLAPHFGQTIMFFGYLLGVITSFTSFITFGLALRKTFTYDLRFPKFIAWTITCFVPLFLFVIGIQNFLTVISVTGALFIGIEAIIVFLIYIRFKTVQKRTTLPRLRFLKVVSFAMVVVLLTGVWFEILALLGAV